MATIRKRAGKFQVQVRRLGCPALSKTFHSLQDARLWARQMEIKADRKELPDDPRALDRLTLGDLVVRYRNGVTPRKRGMDVERIVLTAFLRHPICLKRVSDLSSADFALYRDERLKASTSQFTAPGVCSASQSLRSSQRRMGSRPSR